MEKLNYTYSQLSSSSVRELIKQQYDLADIVSCKFYVLGLHDNYFIETEHEKYILRIYRNDWRTWEEIQFELELLKFIESKQNLVAAPIITCSESLSFDIDCPEGKRTVALFRYADGLSPGKNISIEQSNLLGETVAKVHQITDAFETQHTRDVLDLPYLLDDSIAAITPFINTDTKDYLNSLQPKLKNALSSISREDKVFGICQGDVNLHNYHINENDEITLFDFDQCGYGFRAFEIGKLLSSLHSLENKEAVSRAFIKGYQQVRKLSATELDTLPYFEMVSVIWVMAIHAYNPNLIGYKRLEKPYWDRQLSILKELERQLPDYKAQPENDYMS
jgi:Ser/Thr protein kinase RdoA (MazF antagonist)